MFLNFLLNNSINRYLLLTLNDTVIVFVSAWIGFSIRYDSFRPLDYYFYKYLVIALSLYFVTFYIFKINKHFVRFFNLQTIYIYIKLSLIFGLLLLMTLILGDFINIPRSLGILHPLILCIVLLINRKIAQIVLSAKSNITPKKIIIIGMNALTNKIIERYSIDQLIKGIIDLSSSKTNRSIDQVKIYSFDKLNVLLSDHNINQIIISGDIEEYYYTQVIKNSYDNNIAVYSSKYENNHLIIKPIINIFQLLNKIKPKSINLHLLNNKSILITGGGGSIGREIALQVVKSKPLKLVIIESNELNLYNLQAKIKNQLKILQTSIDIDFILDDFANLDMIDFLYKKFNFNIIYHAAAYKHVPMVEENVISGLKNNFINTFKLAKYFLDKNIDSFILVSTDKAVRPTNLMGVTKRLSELGIKYLHTLNNNIKYSSVRFGNVIESSGSVIPLFINQIESGGPVTVTDKNITRYFMTIEEAANLVIETTFLSKNNETFLLDMGEPIKIYDLAKKIILFYGLLASDKKEENKIEIKITGLRKGEKMFEELLVNNDAIKTIHPLIYIDNENDFNPIFFEEIYKITSDYVENFDKTNFMKIIKNPIIGYNEI